MPQSVSLDGAASDVVLNAGGGALVDDYDYGPVVVSTAALSNAVGNGVAAFYRTLYPSLSWANI